MRRRKDNLRERPCVWCGQPFRAKRTRGVEARFHQRACFYAAKQANGVIRREGS